MPTIKAAILGFGTVGEGIYRIINEKKKEIEQQTGFTIEIATILVRDIAKKRISTPGVQVTDDIREVFGQPQLDIVFEAIVGEEPAYTYLSEAIAKGYDVITANKTMFATHGPALLQQAEEKGGHIGFEATTAGGVPIIQTVKNLLTGDRVHRIQGILNGTSNFILTKMRKEGLSFKAALQEAQNLGYAEADPTDDISGKDAFRKLMILSQLAFGKQPEWKTIDIQGIDKIKLEDVLEATNLHYRHIADIEIDENGNLSGSVAPVLIGPDHPFYGIDGVDNAIIVETEYLGALTLVGPGAGMYPTGSAMVNDFIRIAGVRKKELITS
ncbi:homoserine dehydrogenase [Sporosarcina pasteurii]|uniref:Homoserine dehydrogenase n=1 Tax=Sporosarcina pasteurii TaxID=1474 RepID=A0A380BBU6_SPOPA|nr:homoserine dehydrogenase [Sporosarcina pasteurii]MDS9472855.1 homoserine dehydrogenase [Sporosarcina pasteurii]QBQ06408.1 homoserine dehydrogenase [Sporosarcina pasteurii]SUI98772.1 Homoserine dehydrogenase [Sporosarcina pasteurii]